MASTIEQPWRPTKAQLEAAKNTTLPDLMNRPLHVWLDLEWRHTTPSEGFDEGHGTRRARQIVRDTARDQYRFSSIVMGIVKSAPFQMRKSE